MIPWLTEKGEYCMDYRVLPHGGEKISVIGLGMGGMTGTTDEIAAIVDRAIGAGINFFDMAGSVKTPFCAYAQAFEGRRSKVYTQMHFGANYDSGKYGWTLELESIKATFEWQKSLFGYTDFGFIHCIDDEGDLEEVLKPNGIFDYIKAQKAEGAVRHLGFSSHNPMIARRLLDTGVMDLFMFSINPAYDYARGEYGIGEVAQRSALYRDCQKEGVAISVMKPFGGGQLLSDKLSPFHQALTKNQCIKYALDRPAVITVLPGVRSMQDLEEVLEYVDAGDEEKDYSVISRFTPQSAFGNCVYCNHCQPCPAQLNVGLINKYYDLAKAGDALAKEHYNRLKVTAADCAKCGHCEERCPFRVRQMDRMEEICRFFGK